MEFEVIWPLFRDQPLPGRGDYPWASPLTSAEAWGVTRRELPAKKRDKAGEAKAKSRQRLSAKAYELKLLTEKQKEQIRDLHFNKGYSCTRAAQRMGVSRWAVRVIVDTGGA